mgnify:CR=1 FL=1
MEYLESKFFLLAITFGFFFLSKQLQKKTGLIILNPILIAIALLICFLKLTNVSYEKYEHIPVFTIEEMDAVEVPHKEWIVKNLFLRDDKKRNYYLKLSFHF